MSDSSRDFNLAQIDARNRYASDSNVNGMKNDGTPGVDKTWQRKENIDDREAAHANKYGPKH